MPRSAIAVSLLTLAASAQSPLVVAPAGGALFTWTVPATNPQTFFDLTVHTTITVQGLASPIVSPAGQQGTIELWMTNAGIATYVGNETNAASWHRAAAGSVVANGTTGSTAQLTCFSCQDAGSAGLVLLPGTYGCAVRYIGVANQFCAVPAVPNVASTAELSLTGGAIQYSAFATTPSGVGGGYAGWSWYGSISYANGVAPHVCAVAASYGSGCLRRHASIYAHYTSAAAAASALDGRSLTFVPNSLGGYTVMPGIPLFSYAAPTGAATQVPVANDGEYQQALTTPFAHPGGIATSLFIHANGYVSLASNNVLAGPNWLPAPPSLLNASATGWWIWHDLAPTQSGSGAIWFEEAANGLVYVTWLDVESYPTSITNPSTFQLVFDPGSGIVTMNFVALDAIGGATYPPGDGWVVGYSPGGPSPDPSPTDLTALAAGAHALVSLPPGEVLPLALAASAKPRLGTTIDLLTSNATGQGVGVLVLGTAASQPAIDLSLVGAPGCSVLVDVAAGVGFVISNVIPGLGMNGPLAIPNGPGLLGLSLYAQSAWLDATANALGMVTSNGVRLQLGNY